MFRYLVFSQRIVSFSELTMSNSVAYQWVSCKTFLELNVEFIWSWMSSCVNNEVARIVYVYWHSVLCYETFTCFYFWYFGYSVGTFFPFLLGLPSFGLRSSPSFRSRPPGCVLGGSPIWVCGLWFSSLPFGSLPCGLLRSFPPRVVLLFVSPCVVLSVSLPLGYLLLIVLCFIELFIRKLFN